MLRRSLQLLLRVRLRRFRRKTLHLKDVGCSILDILSRVLLVVRIHIPIVICQLLRHLLGVHAEPTIIWDVLAGASGGGPGVEARHLGREEMLRLVGSLAPTSSSSPLPSLRIHMLLTTLRVWSSVRIGLSVARAGVIKMLVSCLVWLI